MSWFKHIPRAKEPKKLVPREPSPTTEKLLKESRDAVREKNKK